MTKPKATENKTENTEVSAKRAKLERELGQLTYKIAICNTQMVTLQKQREPLTERSNQIANILEGLDNGKNS